MSVVFRGGGYPAYHRPHRDGPVLHRAALTVTGREALHDDYVRDRMQTIGRLPGYYDVGLRIVLDEEADYEPPRRRHR